MIELTKVNNLVINFVNDFVLMEENLDLVMINQTHKLKYFNKDGSFVFGGCVFYSDKTKKFYEFSVQLESGEEEIEYSIEVEDDYKEYGVVIETKNEIEVLKFIETLL